jgi:hypothetical protein
MRDTKADGSTVKAPREALRRGLRFAILAAGIGLVITAGAARAGDDDEEDDMTFEERIVDSFMKGLGGTNMENRGIDYRERSPLVVPPKLNLPPPVSTSAEVKAPNWPKDPDEARRKAAIAAKKKERKKDPREYARPLTPSELNVGKTAAPARTNNDPVQPGVTTSPILSPSQLGFDGGMFGRMFKGNKEETAEFKGEPPRESLVEPPPGYQTPSPNYAYGTGPMKPLHKTFDVLSGKERE